MHPQEIAMVFKNENGVILPTREFTKLSKSKLSRGHEEALYAQGRRQAAELLKVV